MKKLDLGQTLQLLGNLGIIVGILLLVYELNQNRHMIMAQTRNELAQEVTNILFELQNNAEMAEIAFRRSQGEELSEFESVQYRLRVMAQLRYHENVHYQYRNGLYEEAEFSAQRDYWRNVVFHNEGLVEIWCSVRSGFSPEFVEEINGLLTTYRCE